MIAVVDKSIVRKIVIIIKEIDLIKKQYISYRDKEKVCDRRTPPLKVGKTNSLQNFSPLRRKCLKRQSNKEDIPENIFTQESIFLGADTKAHGGHCRYAPMGPDYLLDDNRIWHHLFGSNFAHRQNSSWFVIDFSKMKKKTHRKNSVRLTNLQQCQFSCRKPQSGWHRKF